MRTNTLTIPHGALAIAEGKGPAEQGRAIEAVFDKLTPAGRGPMGHRSPRSHEIVLLDRFDDAGRYIPYDEDDEGVFPTIDEWEKVNDEHPGDWAVMITRGSSPSQDANLVAYAVFARYFGVLPENVSKVAVLEQRINASSPWVNMAYALASAGVEVLSDYSGLVGCEPDPLIREGLVEASANMEPGRRPERGLSLAVLPEAFAAAYSDEELGAMALDNLLEKSFGASLFRGSLGTKTDRSSTFADRLASAEKKLANLSLSRLSFSQGLKSIASAGDDWMPLPFHSLGLPASTNSYTEEVAGIKSKLDMLEWAWSVYAASAGVEMGDPRGGGGGRGAIIGTALADIAVQDGFAEVVYGVSDGSISSMGALVESLAPFCVPARSFVGTSIAAGPPEDGGAVIDLDDYDSFACDQRAYSLGLSPSPGTARTYTRATDAMSKAVAVFAAGVATAEGKQQQSMPVAVIDVRDGANAVAFNYERAKAISDFEAVEAISPGDWSVATVPSEDEATSPEVCKMLQAVGLGLVATGKVSPGSGKLAVIGGKWDALGEDGDAVAQKISAVFSAGGVEHVSDATGRFDGVDDLTSGLIDQRKDVKGPGRPHRTRSIMYRLREPEAAAPWVTEKLIPLATAELIRSSFDTNHGRQFLDLEEVTGELLETMSFGFKNVSDFPMSAVKEIAQNDALRDIAHACHMLDLFYPLEDYAQLPEWFGDAKLARDIYTIWFSELSAAKLKIAEMFPLGADKRRMHMLGDSLGIKVKVRTYLAGIPLEDLVNQVGLR